MLLKDLKGVGPKTLKGLENLGIYSLNDLLNYYPYRYQVLSPENFGTLEEKSGCIVGKIESNPRISYIKRNLNRISFRFLTSNKIINVTIFNRAFLKNKIEIGKEITLIGKYNSKTNTFTASDIRFYSLTCSLVEPKYHLNKNIKSSLFNKLIASALTEEVPISDYIPIYLNKTYHFIEKKEAIKEIHHPTNLNILKKAKLKLIYEELFVFMFKINYLKYKNMMSHDYLKRNFKKTDINTFIKKLPFKLTIDQEKAVNDIINDFKDKKRMNRLILGDVGSGKTIVAFIAMYINHLSNYQSVLMAPTEILAQQHYENIINVFQEFNLNIKLLTGSLKKSEKQQIADDVKTGKIDIIIGTHAVLNENLTFNNLGLVITDEQHRFGVNQRSNLQNKGQQVDVIYLSATPIPRTYALTLYGDMDTSIIKSKPQGRKDIITKLKKESELKAVLQHILAELKLGHQVYVVAPSIEESETTELENVNSLKEKFTKAFKGLVKIGVLHGRQKSSEKEKIMADFLAKKYNILISTTVIEVGIDIKNATMIVIFNAERFGLATLHQLRGRVGRNELDSYCYLISNYEKERLEVLTRSNDGFYISEQDFLLRGEGDVFGSRQSGDMTFKIANLKRDYKILLQAKQDSEQYLQEIIKNNTSSSYYNGIIKELDFID